MLKQKATNSKPSNDNHFFVFCLFFSDKRHYRYLFCIFNAVSQNFNNPINPIIQTPFDPNVLR